VIYLSRVAKGGEQPTPARRVIAAMMPPGTEFSRHEVAELTGLPLDLVSVTLTSLLSHGVVASRGRGRWVLEPAARWRDGID